MRLTLLFVLACSGVTAQTFEVASVKPAAPYKSGPIHIATTGGPGTDNPTRLTFSNATLSMVFRTAFDLQDTQTVNGPDWLNIDMFDIEAGVPAGATRDQMRTMLQNLLAERFQMRWHREKQELPAYVLLVGNGRLRLPVAGNAKPTQNERSGPGFRRVSCGSCTVGQFVKMLGRPEDRIVFDETGLAGTYDFALTYEPIAGVCKGCTVGGSGVSPPPPPPSPDDAPPILSVALSQQLGLRLERKQRPVAVIVIDHIDRIPVSN